MPFLVRLCRLKAKPTQAFIFDCGTFAGINMIFILSLGLTTAINVRLSKLNPSKCQFHQHFTLSFFVQNFGTKNYKAERITFVQNFGAKNALLYKKHACKMLIKLTSA
jgi:hypothetical protein